MDKRSDSAEHFGNDQAAYESYRKFHDGLAGLKKPEKLSAVIEKGLDSYAAVFFPVATLRWWICRKTRTLPRY